MWNISDKVAFFSLHETWNYVNDWKRYIEHDITYYEIVDKLSDENDNLDSIIVINNQGMRIPVDINEYLIHTKETLKKHFESTNSQYAAICNKVKQLYRKHNNSDSRFKFQGV